MGGSAPIGGSNPLIMQQLMFDMKANTDASKRRLFPGSTTPDRGPRPGQPTGFGPAKTPATPEKEATKSSSAQLDRGRRRPSSSGRLTAPSSVQRRTLLGE